MFILYDGICQDDTMLKVFGLVKFVLNVICVIVPIVMIVLGTIDLFKAVVASKEEEIKKRQNTLITRLIAGIIVFLVPAIVTLIMGLIGQGGTGKNDWGRCWEKAKTGAWKDLFKTN